MKQLIESNQKYVPTPEKSAAREFVDHICDTVNKFVKIPADFNKNYVPHQRMALAVNTADRVRAFVKTNNKVASSELRGLVRIFKKVCRE